MNSIVPSGAFASSAATESGSQARVPSIGGRRAITMARAARVLSPAVALVAAGCGTLPRNAVPIELMPEAGIPDMPGVRAWAGRPSEAMMSDLARSFAQESRDDFPVGADGLVHYAHLALSGGGPNGAFGAGFLDGWTKTGKRPVFKIVTGVSTGALMAPFAFLGAPYDSVLREFYTTTASRNIFRPLSLVRQLLVGESLADTEPLATLIANTVDAQLLARIAQAHEQGRRLYVGTVDLDAQRFVVWNMGLIASSGRPEALALFRRVMLASASVPIAFPPVFFDVEAGGRRYDEMHVDGAVAARVFYTGGVFSFAAVRAAAGKAPGREDIFVIHNGQLLPVAQPTARSIRSIAVRVLESSGKSALVGDLFRIFAVTQQEGASFQWVTIPNGVEITGNETFDPVKMTQLYDLGRETAMAGPIWSTRPPGLGQRLAPGGFAPAP
jgi:predicted acylesterase/phospholipase RssA